MIVTGPLGPAAVRPSSRLRARANSIVCLLAVTVATCTHGCERPDRELRGVRSEPCQDGSSSCDTSDSSADTGPSADALTSGVGFHVPAERCARLDLGDGLIAQLCVGPVLREMSGGLVKLASADAKVTLENAGPEAVLIDAFGDLLLSVDVLDQGQWRECAASAGGRLWTVELPYHEFGDLMVVPPGATLVRPLCHDASVLTLGGPCLGGGWMRIRLVARASPGRRVVALDGSGAARALADHGATTVRKTADGRVVMASAELAAVGRALGAGRVWAESGAPREVSSDALLMCVQPRPGRSCDDRAAASAERSR